MCSDETSKRINLVYMAWNCLVKGLGKNERSFPYYVFMNEADLKTYFASILERVVSELIEPAVCELHAEYEVNSNAVDLALLYDEEDEEKVLGIEVKRHGDLLSDLEKLKGLISNGKINAGILVAIVRREANIAYQFENRWDKQFSLKNGYDHSCNSREIVPFDVEISQTEKLSCDAVFVVLRD